MSNLPGPTKKTSSGHPPKVVITKHNPYKLSKSILKGGASPTENHWFKALRTEVPIANYSAWMV